MVIIDNLAKFLYTGKLYHEDVTPPRWWVDRYNRQKGEIMEDWEVALEAKILTEELQKNGEVVEVSRGMLGIKWTWATYVWFMTIRVTAHGTRGVLGLLNLGANSLTDQLVGLSGFHPRTDAPFKVLSARAVGSYWPFRSE